MGTSARTDASTPLLARAARWLLLGLGACSTPAPAPVAAPPVDLGPVCANYCQSVQYQCHAVPDNCLMDCVCRDATRPSCRALQAAYVDCAYRAVLVCATGVPGVLCQQEHAAYDACHANTAETPGAACSFGDAGAPDAGAPDVGVDVPGAAPTYDYRYGTVQGVGDGPGTTSRGYVVEFVHNEATTCTRRLVGDWRVEVCRGVDGERTPVSAGVVSFTRASGANFMLSPSTSGQYSRDSEDGGWTVGETIHIAAAGSSMIPAFETSLAYPSSLESVRLSPAPDSSGLVNHARERGLTINWTPGEGRVRVRILQAADDQSTRVEGFGDRSTGSITVPAEVLAVLRYGEQGAGANVVVSSASTVNVMAGAWPVDVSLLSPLQVYTVIIQ